MQVPSILSGESRTRLLQGIAVGAVASVVIGFSWGGWMTGSSANKLAAERADTRCRGSPHAGLRGEIPAEQRCASEPGSHKKDPFELGTGRIRAEGWLGDTAGGYLHRLSPG